MNELSWLIYLADVAGTAKGLAVGGLAVCGIIAVGGIIGYCINSDTTTYSWEKREEVMPFRDKQKKMFLRLPQAAWKIAIVFSLIVALFPSSGTIYAIAASEMGEQVIKSETAGKALKALDAWLDRQIAEPAK